MYTHFAQWNFKADESCAQNWFTSSIIVIPSEKGCLNITILTILYDLFIHLPIRNSTHFDFCSV